MKEEVEKAFTAEQYLNSTTKGKKKAIALVPSKNNNLSFPLSQLTNKKGIWEEGIDWIRNFESRGHGREEGKKEHTKNIVFFSRASRIV